MSSEPVVHPDEESKRVEEDEEDGKCKLTVTPYDVSDVVDYDKLIIEFGTAKIEPEMV